MRRPSFRRNGKCFFIGNEPVVNRHHVVVVLGKRHSKQQAASSKQHAARGDGQVSGEAKHTLYAVPLPP